MIDNLIFSNLKVGKEKLLAKILGKTEMLWLMTTNNHTIQSVLRNTIKFLIVRVWVDDEV